MLASDKIVEQEAALTYFERVADVEPDMYRLAYDVVLDTVSDDLQDDQA